MAERVVKPLAWQTGSSCVAARAVRQQTGYMAAERSGAAVALAGTVVAPNFGTTSCKPVRASMGSAPRVTILLLLPQACCASAGWPTASKEQASVINHGGGHAIEGKTRQEHEGTGLFSPTHTFVR